MENLFINLSEYFLFFELFYSIWNEFNEIKNFSHEKLSIFYFYNIFIQFIVFSKLV